MTPLCPLGPLDQRRDGVRLRLRAHGQAGRPARAAVGETAILLRPPQPVLDVSIGMERERQQRQQRQQRSLSPSLLQRLLKAERGAAD